MKLSINYSTIRFMLVVFVAVIVIGDGSAYADFTFGTPTNLGAPINSPYNEEEMTMPADGLSVFFVSNRPGGHGHYDIWVAKRQSIEDPWGEPENLGPTINSGYPEFYVSISPDGLTLYYSDGPTYWTPRPGGLGNGDIWVTRRASVADPWTEPVNIGAPVNSSNADVCPSISADGLILVFNRTNSYKQPELWLATRKTTSDPWDTPLKLANVNGGRDWAPSISGDGRTLFWHPGGGEIENYMATRATMHEDFGNPEKLPYPVNTEYVEGMPYISPDGSVFYFVSDRPGGVGGHDLWQAPIYPIVDISGDGIVDVEDVVIMTEHWGENYSLCDIGPTPLGDGIVDIQDLMVLTEYIEPIDRTLIAHWALDETEGDIAQDSAGDNDAFVIGGPLWLPSGGQVDGALMLDGLDDSVVTGPTPNLAERPFSVFVWVIGGAPGQVVLSQIGVANWLLADPTEGNLMTELKTSGRSAVSLMSQTNITGGSYHHIGLVWDGSHRTLYVDGIEVAKDMQDNLEGSDNGLYIGTGKAMEAGTYWSGPIDDVRIYNVALTAEEIAALAQ